MLTRLEISIVVLLISQCHKNIFYCLGAIGSMFFVRFRDIFCIYIYHLIMIYRVSYFSLVFSIALYVWFGLKSLPYGKYPTMCIFSNRIEMTEFTLPEIMNLFFNEIITIFVSIPIVCESEAVLPKFMNLFLTNLCRFFFLFFYISRKRFRVSFHVSVLGYHNWKFNV